MAAEGKGRGEARLCSTNQCKEFCIAKINFIEMCGTSGCVGHSTPRADLFLAICFGFGFNKGFVGINKRNITNIIPIVLFVILPETDSSVK